MASHLLPGRFAHHEGLQSNVDFSSAQLLGLFLGTTGSLTSSFAAATNLELRFFFPLKKCTTSENSLLVESSRIILFKNSSLILFKKLKDAYFSFGVFHSKVKMVIRNVQVNE